MQRICAANVRIGFLCFLASISALSSLARADLIRSTPSRSFPDIAGDIVGAQTYTYDPVSQTGVFQVVNAPHLISLGPSPKDMFQMLPEQDGTLTQSLQMKLDRHGRLINSPANTFEIRGTVVIGAQTFQGVLLRGTPTAFGSVLPDDARSREKNAEVFDLSMKITEGKLKDAFGSEAYLRITPQAGTTFDGRFTIDFSSDKPLTNLRPSRSGLPAAVPEPSALITFLTIGAGVLVFRLRRRFAARPRRRCDDSAPSGSPSERASLERTHSWT
jgi:hypothetical protein